MKIIGLLVVFTLIIIFEAPRLWKQKMWREAAAFSFFLIFGMVLAFLSTFNIKFPNPNDVVAKLFAPIADAIYAWLK